MIRFTSLSCEFLREKRCDNGHISKTGVVRGFTLIELLVVIAIISLLVSILLPSLEAAKEMARSTVCQANLRNISFGILTYAEDYNMTMCASWSTSWPNWWPQALFYYGYMPNPGLHGDYSDGMRKVWVCPTAEMNGLRNGAKVIAWTYLRMSNDYPFWEICGTASRIKLDSIKNPGDQIFLTDGLIASEDIGTGIAGSGYCTMTRYGMTGGNYLGTGGVGYHHKDRGNMLFSDWHVESLVPGDVTQSMCDEPD